MHGCKRCPIEPFIHSFDACTSTYKTREVSYLTLSFSHKEFEEKTGEITEKTVAKEQPGVFCAVKDSNLRNNELGHDSRHVPTSSNFMQFQFSTGPDTWNSKFEVARSISLSIRFQFPRFDLRFYIL